MALSVSLRVEDMPEVLASMRYEMARILRDVANGEDGRTARRLREVAAAFESGQKPEVVDGAGSE